VRWTLGYRDGAANGYWFEADGDGATFVYDPVTPEQSSTGRYSGGPPRAGRLDAATVRELWRHVRALEGDPALRAVDRDKGTGAFDVADEAGRRAFIIARGPELLAFDAFVAAL
jgi:hypothetical protein